MEKTKGLDHFVLKRRIILLRILKTEPEELNAPEAETGWDELVFQPCVYILQEFLGLPLKLKFIWFPLFGGSIWSHDLQEELDTMSKDGLITITNNRLCISKEGFALAYSLPKVSENLNQKYSSHFKLLSRLMVMTPEQLQSFACAVSTKTTGQELDKEQIGKIDNLLALAKEAAIKPEEFDVSPKEDEIAGVRGKSPSKIDLWLHHYLDETNRKTFMNATQSAKAAGYNCSSEHSFQVIGHENLRKVVPQVNEWMNKAGITSNRIEAKLVKMIDATKTEVRTYPANHIVEREEIEDYPTQLQAVRLAMKFKGMDAPKKHEHSGPGGKPLECRITPDMSAQEASDAYSQVLREIKGE